MITVIIPAYNAEKTIRKAVESVCSCKGDFECIVVNDGSSDNTALELQRLLLENPTLRIIHKNNEGVSSARNEGLNCAKGDWILFLDADDWLMDNWFEIVQKSIKIDCDFFVYRYNNILEKSSFVNMYSYNDDSKRVEKLLLLTPELNTCWGKLFKRQIINENHLRFKTNIQFGEDFIFVAEYICFSKVVRFENDVLLNYVNNPRSVMNSNSLEKRLDDNLYLLKMRLEMAKHSSIDNIEQGVYRHHFKVLTAMLIDISKLPLTSSSKNEIYRMLKRHPYTLAIMSKMDARVLTLYKKIEYLMLKKMFFLAVPYFSIKGHFRKEHSIT